VCSTVLTEEAVVVSGCPASTQADMALLLCDPCAVLRPAHEVRSERPQALGAGSLYPQEDSQNLADNNGRTV
jgi:hypothetical protein